MIGIALLNLLQEHQEQHPSATSARLVGIAEESGSVPNTALTVFGRMSSARRHTIMMQRPQKASH